SGARYRITAADSISRTSIDLPSLIGRVIIPQNLGLINVRYGRRGDIWYTDFPFARELTSLGGTKQRVPGGVSSVWLRLHKLRERGLDTCHCEAYNYPHRRGSGACNIASRSAGGGTIADAYKDGKIADNE